MKIHINPQYEHLRKEITDTVNGNYIATKVFCHNRNIVEKFNMQGKEYVIKIYKQPNIINRIAYKYFRMSKAKRAFIYAERLLALGIDTPQPVAYIERREREGFSQQAISSRSTCHTALCVTLIVLFPIARNAVLQKISLILYWRYILKRYFRSILIQATFSTISMKSKIATVLP